QQYREFVEALDASGQLRPVHEINCDVASLTARRVQKRILYVLRCRLRVHPRPPVGFFYLNGKLRIKKITPRTNRKQSFQPEFNNSSTRALRRVWISKS